MLKNHSKRYSRLGRGKKKKSAKCQGFLKCWDRFPQEEFLSCAISILETQNLTGHCLEQPEQLSIDTALQTGQDQMTSEGLFKPKFSKIPWKYAALLVGYI